MLLYRAEEREREGDNIVVWERRTYKACHLVGVNAFTYAQTGNGREGRRGGPCVL